MARKDPTSHGRASRPAIVADGPGRNGLKARHGGGPPHSGSRVSTLASGDLVAALTLTALAWIHRVLFVLSNRDRSWPLTIFYEGDAETFFRHARALVAGHLYEGGLPFHPPGFPFLLSWVHLLLGAGGDAQEIPHLAVKVALALVSSVAVGLLYVLARPFLGRVAAAITCLLVTYHFGLMVVAIAPVSEGLYVTLLVAAMLIWSRLLPATPAPPLPPIAGIALGATLGALALTRAEGLGLAAVLVTVGAVAELAVSRRMRTLTPWLLAGMSCVVVIAPWSVRNHHRLTEVNRQLGPSLAEPLPSWVPVTLYGPLNLGMANRAGADGTFSPSDIDGGSGRLELTNPAVLDLILHGDEHAWHWIRHDPDAFLELTLRRWRLSGQAFRLGFGQTNWPGGLSGTRRPVDVFLPRGSGAAWPLAVLCLIGLVVCLRRRPGRMWLAVVAAPTFMWLISTGFFFGYARLALIVMPFWLSLAAVPLAAVTKQLLQRWRRATTVVILALIAAALIIEARGATADRNYRASGTTVGGGKLNRDATMTIELMVP